MNTVTPLSALWEQPFELLLAMQARLRASGEEHSGVGAQDEWIGLGFTLDGQHYVAPQNDVREVLEMPKVTRVPRAKPWLMGVANVRGDLLPVIDLGCLLGREQTRLSDASRVVVLNDDDVPAGFLVDDVAGFRGFAAQDQRHELLDEEPLNAPMQKFLLGAFVRDGTAWRAFSLRKLAADPVLSDAGL